MLNYVPIVQSILNNDGLHMHYADLVVLTYEIMSCNL